jgi:cyanate permease
MVFDTFVALNSLWGFLCISIIFPALAERKYPLIFATGILILITHSIFLHFNQKMLFSEALLRSTAVALANILVPYLLVHFFHHKRSMKDLFRRKNVPDSEKRRS